MPHPIAGAFASTLTDPPTFTDPSDGRIDDGLIAAALADRRAFAPLYRRHVDAVYRYCRGQLGDADAAEEATAEAFADALASLHRFRGDGPFAAWLIGIARRKVVDHWRRHRRWVPLDPRPRVAHGPESDPGDGHDVIEAGRVSAALAALTPRDRELVDLRFAAGLPFAQIAALTGRSEAATKMALRRVLDRLAVTLDVQETPR